MNWTIVGLFTLPWSSFSSVRALKFFTYLLMAVFIYCKNILDFLLSKFNSLSPRSNNTYNFLLLTFLTSLYLLRF